MDDLHPLNEATILANIAHRFRMDQIYTRTGPILIAMNPFKWLPTYGSEVVRQYHGRAYGSLPPHCYQEAEDAYQQLQHTQVNQSVVICGESGAGKTETTKLMLQYISIVARGGVENAGSGSGGGGRGKGEGDVAVAPTIGERLVQSNPLMEAFGNAKTLRNNNSRWVYGGGGGLELEGGVWTYGVWIYYYLGGVCACFFFFSLVLYVSLFICVLDSHHDHLPPPFLPPLLPQSFWQVHPAQFSAPREQARPPPLPASFATTTATTAGQQQQQHGGRRLSYFGGASQ